MRSPPRARTAVFRLDASAALGGGHAVRSLALADALAARGWHSTFVVAEPGVSIVRSLARSRHEVVSIPARSALDADPLKSAVGSPPDLLVVDHYGWSAPQESACRGWARRVFVVDDLCDRVHDCDVLLDVSLGRAGADYAGHVPSSCEVLTGAGYALLREEFPRERMAARTHPTHAVFVGFGLADTANLTARTLDALRTMRFDGTVHVVLGRDAPHLATVRKAVSGNVRLHIAPERIAPVMSVAALAVGAGGGSVWERCCLGLASVAVCAAANQEQNLRTLSAAGACELTDIDNLAATLQRLLGHRTRVTEMSAAAAAITDGRGAARVALALDPEPTRAGGHVSLRRVAPADAPLLLEWQRHPETRRHARNPDVPSPEQHAAWVARKLADRGCVLDLVLHEGAPAGVVRVDRTVRAGTSFACEVSIYVAPALYGRGIGRAALAALRRLVPEAPLVAHVLPDNAASHALFAGAGYEVANGVYISWPRAGGG